MTRGVGRLEFPGNEHVAAPGEALLIRGWVLFDGWPADTIEVFLGDAPGVLARRATPRPDLLGKTARLAPGAIGGGFSAGVAIPRGTAPGRLEIRVRAVASDGSVWHSQTTALQIDPARMTHSDAVMPSWRPTRPATRAPGPLRVGVFTHSLEYGGGELYLDELLRRLRTEHDVQLMVVTQKWGPLAAGLEAAGMPVLLSPGPVVDPLRYESRVAELQSLLVSWGADVVLANTLGVFEPVDAGVRLGLPAVWAIHESFELDYYLQSNWGRPVVSDHVVSRVQHSLVSAHTIFEAEATLELFASRLPRMRGRHVHYGIDLAEIARFRQAHSRQDLRAAHGLEPDDIVLLCMGVFQERKTQLGLVLAFAEIADLHPNAKLVLVGARRGGYTRAVRQTVRRLGLQDQVVIEPVQPDIYSWYQLSDAMVSASDIESLPRSILEAKAFGLPTLATDVFGVAEVITDGVNGWLCRPASGTALATGLQRVLTSTPTERSRMAETCISEAVRFDGAGYANTYYELMTTLAGLSPAGSSTADREPAHA